MTPLGANSITRPPRLHDRRERAAAGFETGARSWTSMNKAWAPAPQVWRIRCYRLQRTFSAYDEQSAPQSAVTPPRLSLSEFCVRGIACEQKKEHAEQEDD
jgi:hypothetical protein